MIHRAFEEVCNRLLPAMWMIWKASSGLYRKMIEHEEGREVFQLRRSYRTSHSSTCAFSLLTGEERFADRSWNCHVGGFRYAVNCAGWNESEAFECRCAVRV